MSGNKKEFLELIERYESVSIDEITSVWSEVEKSHFKYTWQIARNVAKRLTGHGSTNTCTLCQRVNQDCRKCHWFYETDEGCAEGENLDSFCAIGHAKTPEELHQSFKKRAEYMRKFKGD